MILGQSQIPNFISNHPAHNYEVEFLDEGRSPYLGTDKDPMPALQGKFKELGIAFNLFSNVWWTSGNPFVYEPKSNTLIFAQSSRARLPEGSDTANFTGSLFLYISQDGGENWQVREVYRKWGHVPTNPSVAVLNPTNTNNPADLQYVIYTRYFIPSWATGQPVLELKGALFLVFTGNNWEYMEYPEEGPLSNNPGSQQRWILSNTVASDAKNGNWFYTAGVLSPANNFVQYGSYGVSYIGLDSYDVGSSIPPHFNHDQFRPSTSTNTSYQSPVEIDVDPTGNVYVAVNNFFLPYNDDGRDRVIGVAKSTDNGKTYSQFRKMSRSIIDNFVEFKGGNPSIGIPIPGSYPYGTSGFRVYGEDEYSYVYRIFSYYGTEEGQLETYIVEAFHKDGQWGMRDISTFTGYKWRIPYVIQDTNSVMEQDVFVDNTRQHEVQLSRTADGQYLVAKWIDNRNELAKLTNRVQIVNLGGVDSMLTTDIFYSYRAINSTQWSPPYNLTDDMWMNNATIIPPVLPSINNIPIIEHATVRFTNPSDPRYNYPYFVQNYVVGTAIRKHILFASFDGLNPSKIGNPSIQNPEGVSGASVRENNYSFRIHSLTPNPATDEAYINYQLDRPGFVTIDIYNALGQKVLNVRNSHTDKGVWQAYFSVSDLPAGTYYCTLSLEGKTVTRMMNVVR
jgi:hypothetical protein